MHWILPSASIAPSTGNESPNTHEAYRALCPAPPDTVTCVPPRHGPELGCNETILMSAAQDPTYLMPFVLKSAPLLLTSTVTLPIEPVPAIRQCTSDELTYLACVPVLHCSACEGKKCLPVTRSTRPSPLLDSSTPLTVGARSYTNCTSLDVTSAPLLLTSTDTVCSTPALGDTHAIMLEVSHRPLRRERTADDRRGWWVRRGEGPRWAVR